MDVIVDVQGFQMANNDFIPKEIGILCDEQATVILIKPPFPYYELSAFGKENVAWVEHTKRIYWNEGLVPYKTYKRSIEYLKTMNIYIKGREKYGWLKKILTENEKDDTDTSDDADAEKPADNLKIFDLEELGCPSLERLRKKYKSSMKDTHCNYHPGTCAYTNINYISRWALENDIFSK